MKQMLKNPYHYHLKWMVRVLFISGVNFLFGNKSLFSQGFTIYQDKTFGTPFTEHGWCLRYYQNHLYMVGVTASANPGGDQSDSICVSGAPVLQDLWLIKTDLQLNKIWDRCIGGNRYDGGPEAFFNSSGHIIISCRSNSDSSCEKSENVRYAGGPSFFFDYWIVAYDTSGNKLWDKTFGGILEDQFPITVQLTSGNYVVCGGSYSPVGYDKSVANWGGADYWCVKFDSTGNKIWDQVYGGTGGEYSTNNGGAAKHFYLIPDDDDSFVIAGTISGSVSGNVSQPSYNPALPDAFGDIWIIKVDSLGNKIWDRRYGGDFSDLMTGCIKKVSDGYIVVGNTGSSQGGSVSQPPIGLDKRDVWVLKLDTSGNKIWDRRYGGAGQDAGAWIEPAIDGGYIICAQTNSPAGNDITEPPYGNQSGDYWIFKIDTAGNKLWDKRFGGPGSNLVDKFIQMPDSSIYLFGAADSGTTAVKTDPGKGGLDYWIVYFKYVDAPLGIMETVYGTGHLYITPNPATTHLTLKYSPPKTTGRATVFNATGMKVSEIILPTGSHSHQLDISQYPSGLYLLKIETERYAGAKKFFKL